MPVDVQGTRPNTYGAGHIRREDLTTKLLDAHHCTEFDVQEIGVPFVIRFQTVAGTTNKDVTVPKHIKLHVVNAWGIMTGAGAAGDTVKLQKVVTGPTATDITDAVDVSAKSDKVFFNFGTFDNAEWELNGTAGDILRCVQASDALAAVFVLCVRVPT